MNELTKFLLLLIAYFAMCAYGIIVGGFVFSCLWSWFIVPLFVVTELTVIQSAGIMAISSFLLAPLAMNVQRLVDNSDAKWGYVETVLPMLLLPWITLIFGFIITLFL